MNDMTDDQASVSQERLKSLSNFQVVILKHVFSFPNVKRVVYSTCSIHPEENEAVVQEVMNDISDNFLICKIFPDWPYRGQEGYDHSDCFLRMTPKNALTNGFFVACFERKCDKKSEKSLTDDDVIEDMCHSEVSKHKSKKKKRKHQEEKNQDSDNTQIIIKSKKKHKKEKKHKIREDSDNTQPTVTTKKKHKRSKDSPRTEVDIETRACSEHKKHKAKYAKQPCDTEEEQGDVLETVLQSSGHSKKRRHKELECPSAAENGDQEIKRRKKKNKKEKPER